MNFGINLTTAVVDVIMLVAFLPSAISSSSMFEILACSCFVVSLAGSSSNCLKELRAKA